MFTAPDTDLDAPLQLPPTDRTGGLSWAQLAAAGPLLWRHRGDAPAPPLHAPVTARARIDSDALLEWIVFDDGHAAWLLPDSDYLGWERLQSRLAAARSQARSVRVIGACTALLQRRLRERGGWRHGVFAVDAGGGMRRVGISAPAAAMMARLVGA